MGEHSRGRVEVKDFLLDVLYYLGFFAISLILAGTVVAFVFLLGAMLEWW